MNSAVIIDTNLLSLLVVGAASRDYIALHKRLQSDFSLTEYELLVELIALFSDIILLPHIVAETSSLIRQIPSPMRSRIQEKFRTLIETTIEFPIPSARGAEREEHQELGITDAVILHCLSMSDIEPTLMTIDRDLIKPSEFTRLQCRRLPERILAGKALIPQRSAK
jgi:hypothetical protein